MQIRILFRSTSRIIFYKKNLIVKIIYFPLSSLIYPSMQRDEDDNQISLLVLLVLSSNITERFCVPTHVRQFVRML